MANAKLARLAAALNAHPTLPVLVLLTDDERLPDPQRAAQQLPRGSMIVVRSRDASRRAELTRDLVKIAHRRDLGLLVADDPEMAMRIGAHGVHFPERRAGDVAYWRARRPRWLITSSAHSLGACADAARFGADAVFLSPVFATRSHPDHASLGAIRLRAISMLTTVPIYALGGIDGHTALSLAGARLAGLAAIGALAV